MKRFFYIFLAFLFLLLGVWGFFFFDAPELMDAKNVTTDTSSEAKENWVSFKLNQSKTAPYRRRQNYDLLGYRVAQFEHTLHHQGFIVLDGMNQELMDSVFDGALLESLIEPMANSILTLKNPKDPDKLYIDSFENLETLEIKAQGRVTPFKKLRLTLHTKKRKTPKTLDLLIGVWRFPKEIEKEKTEKMLAVVVYSGQGQLRPDLLSAFLEELLIKK